jgi:hypothetical protein
MRLGIWELDWKTIGFAIIVLACLLIVVNQSVGLIYKVQLLYSPCALCVQVNPEWASCYKELTGLVPIETSFGFNETKIKELKINFTS